MRVQEDAAKPWGRLTLVSKDPAEDADHIYLTNPVTTIGRNKRRCDHVINQLFISSVHCVVKWDGTDGTGESIIKLHDNSRNGIWVNADRVGKGASVRLDRGYTVHFTKPGATPAGVAPMAFKLEFLNSIGLQPVAVGSKANEVPEDVDTTVVDDESFEVTTQSTAPANSPYLAVKKRKRVDAEPVFIQAATQELESRSDAVESQVNAVESKLRAAKAIVAMEKGLEQSVAAQVDKLTKENMDLMVTLKAASVENLQVKADLAAKDCEMKMKETALEATVNKLREELGAKQSAMEEKHKQALTKSLEADRKAMSQEMAIKLKEETKKYQQKIEAEHYDQRREASEKMAVLVNENENLRTVQRLKDEELAECEDKIACSRDKISALEKMVATLGAKVEKLADCEKTIADLESKLAVLKDESAEIVGLLATAEEKVVAAENKAAKADIAAAAAARANGSFDASKRQKLQNSISSFRCELETYRAQFASCKKEHKKQEAVAGQGVIASPASNTPESTTQNNDAETLCTRLAAASDLFRHVQALGLQGTRLINGTDRSQLDDRHLFSAGTVDTRSTVSNPLSSSPGKDGRHPAADGTKEPFKMMFAKMPVTTTLRDCVVETEADVTVADESAKVETSPTKFK